MATSDDFDSALDKLECWSDSLQLYARKLSKFDPPTEDEFLAIMESLDLVDENIVGVRRSLEEMETHRIFEEFG